MSIAKDNAGVGDLTARYERFDQDCGLGVVQSRMPAADMVLFHDDFSDGKMHGWRPTHFGSDVPQSPVSVEQEYPMPGLFLATGSTPYRSDALANTSSSWKGLSGRFPQTGIVSFGGLFAVQSGGPGSYAFDTWALAMDIQNFKSTLRGSPQWAVIAQTYPSRPQVVLYDETLTQHTVTGLTNPVSGSTVSSTQYLVAGGNEAKWDINYLRVSYDLGNLFTADAGLTAKYYELNINGYRFDLRTQGHDTSFAPQGGTELEDFGGGMNFGVLLSRSATPGSVRPARLTAGDLRATYHETGWLT